ncbi:hypothetical protein ITJ66_07260 [Plantibacter sp. VKM Ac-2885]|uniref:hypothetical protein n=1 Tax=Plantibacter sp. VKM Ac-2885 TaxID=2783828 RepID=UPI001889DAB6|nr:hypothetical protein [Plantibacter sp. VKM Ac-2885]MBF4512286.1 hypothetical protein [Plantibacter sp. VKM Ac-2885]
MSLVEFLAAAGATTWRDRSLLVLYWHAHFRDQRALSGAQIKAALQASRVPKAKQANIADVMLKAGALVDVASHAPGGARLWTLTPTGEAAVRAMANIPETQPDIEHGVEMLRRVVSKVGDSGARAYLEEAVLCLSVNALRAGIVFTWVGAVQVLQARVWTHGAQAVEAAAQKYFPKSRIVKLDDLSTLRESTLLDVARDLGEIDKAQRTVLGQCLDTRNQCGHPNKYDPGVAKAQAHIEDVVGILF